MTDAWMGRINFAPNPPGVERPNGAREWRALTEADVRRIVAEELAKRLGVTLPTDESDIEGAPI